MYLSHLIRAVAEWRRYRKGFQQLQALDDRMLADIGIDRLTIRDAARGAFSR